MKSATDKLKITDQSTHCKYDDQLWCAKKSLPFHSDPQVVGPPFVDLRLSQFPALPNSQI